MPQSLVLAAADTIVVNSQYTASVFKSVFPSLHARPLAILYPPVNILAFQQRPSLPPSPLPPEADDAETRALMHALTFPCVFVSINRYERKKNIALALEALAFVQKHLSPAAFRDVHLVIAGGYDDNNNKDVKLHLWI